MRHTGAKSVDIWEENLTCIINDLASKGMLFTYATGIIDSNENDGVARWLREHAVIERVSKK